MNQEKKTLEITGLPLIPLSVGRSAYIFESDGTRRTSRVLAIQHSSQTEIDFETLNARSPGKPPAIICLTEYNPEKNAGHRLYIGAYQSHLDDPKYYEPYVAERN